MSENITDQDFILAMRSVVREKGSGYVYPASERDRGLGREPVCRYRTTDDDRPSCIVGYALDRLGVDVPAAHEGRGASPVLADLTPSLSPGVRWAAEDAQVKQDSGQTWGEALEAFEAELDKPGVPRGAARPGDGGGRGE